MPAPIVHLVTLAAAVLVVVAVLCIASAAPALIAVAIAALLGGVALGALSPHGPPGR